MNNLFVFTSEKSCAGYHAPIESKNAKVRSASMQAFTRARKELAEGERLLCLTTGG